MSAESDSDLSRQARPARRALLRAATGALHEHLDRALEAWLDGPDADYGAFLAAHRSALMPLEAALEAGDAAALVPDWPHRRKRVLLDADLRALGVRPAQGASCPLALPGPAARLGALYVLEGATLGGALIERRVLVRFPEAAGATRYFASYGRARGAMWRDFLAALEAAPAAWQDEAGLIFGARTAFTHFVDVFARLVQSGRHSECGNGAQSRTAASGRSGDI